MTGAMIEEATDGAALTKIAQAPETIDLVFMDVQMPKLNGYDAAKQSANYHARM
ncbi:MAG: response regulator [Phascolarctobacterium faecium]